MITTKRRPDSVGDILNQEFMTPLGITQGDLAGQMGVSRKTVNEICKNRRAVTADTAMMLSRVFGNSAQFWLNLQMQNDLWEAAQDTKRMERIEKAQPLQAQAAG